MLAPIGILEIAHCEAKQAERCGCKAIFLTLDTTILGWLPRNLDLASLHFLRGQSLAQYLSNPVFLSKGGEPVLASGIRPKGLGVISTLMDLNASTKSFGLSLAQTRPTVGWSLLLIRDPTPSRMMSRASRT